MTGTNLSAPQRLALARIGTGRVRCWFGWGSRHPERWAIVGEPFSKMNGQTMEALVRKGVLVKVDYQAASFAEYAVLE